MKITILNGSPNEKGTCSLIINSLIDNCTNTHQITTYILNSLNIHGCQECFICRNKQNDKCFFIDDLTNILEEVKSTDMLILASPIFYADLSAQIKCFIDRTWSYFGINGQSASHLPQNRIMIFILSFGYPNKNQYNDIYKKYALYFNMFGFNQIDFITAFGAQYFNNHPNNQSEIEHNISAIKMKYGL